MSFKGFTNLSRTFAVFYPYNNIYIQDGICLTCMISFPSRKIMRTKHSLKQLYIPGVSRCDIHITRHGAKITVYGLLV